MKRNIKKKLKEDELATGLGKSLEFVKKWQREMIIAAVAATVVVLFFFGFQLLKAQQVRKDSRTVGEIFELKAGLNKNPENVAKLQKLTSTGKFGRVASIALAAYYIDQGQFDKAGAALADIKDGSRDFFYYQAEDLKAQVDILKGENDKAIDLLKKIEEAKPKDYLLDAVLYHHAEALEKKGNLKEALDIYKKLQTDYPQSYYGYDASLKVQKQGGTK
jgi:predicted negative regulator of RcsB-dependent stress response